MSGLAVAQERWHGTTGGYTNHKCRCGECRRAWRNYQMDIKQRRALTEKDPDDPRHGLASFYGNHGCRCAECTAAWTRAASRRKSASPSTLERRDWDKMAAELKAHPGKWRLVAEDYPRSTCEPVTKRGFLLRAQRMSRDTSKLYYDIYAMYPGGDA